MKAAYLLRFDDICSTMNWQVWHEIEKTLVDLNIRPLLAVVPDNQDAQLMVAPARVGFWATVREWQTRGYAIGVHGYQHRYVTDDPGILRMNRFSEFAGLPEATQRSKLLASLERFREEGVSAGFWVAPAHSFDSTTLKVLLGAGLDVISDGFSAYPCRDAAGMLWIPQQMARFRWMPFGVWTICFHHNRMQQGDLLDFRLQAAKYRSRITSLNKVIDQYESRPTGLLDHAVDGGLRAARRLRRTVLHHSD